MAEFILPGAYLMTPFEGAEAGFEYEPLPVEGCMSVLEDRKESPDGVKLAAKLLLEQAAVSVRYVNTEVTEEKGFGSYFTKISLLGFNDHGGGSESSYKILVSDINNTLGGGGSQYVLLSPPSDDNRPMNLTFHAANFTYPSRPLGDHRYNDVPNPLKTAGRAGQYGYEYLLFGPAETPAEFIRTFRDIGFEFSNDPYTEDKRRELQTITRRLQDSPYAMAQSPSQTWPGGQFAQQISNLQG